MEDNNLIEQLDPAAEDLTGRVVGGYLLMRRLGRGGMAEVYLAEQSSLRRHVALKVLKSSLAANGTFVKRFHQEAQAAAALVQANIVQIYEVGEDQGIHFIAQEYVRGQNLRQFLSRHGAVDPIVAVNIIRQVAAALQKAAEHHVIHRDIKPENIMLLPNGEVKVTDFGLARINDPQRRNDLTQIGITMGTPLYMSPEQVEGKSVDPRSDLYSLGITAYHMLAGDPPFFGDSPLAIALQHVNLTPPPLHEIRPDVPAELSAIIARMMAKAPEDRFQDPSELIRAMRTIEIDFDQWDSVVEKLAVEADHPETAAPRWTESRHAVTRQLQQIMLGNLPSFWRRPATWLTIAAIGLIAFAGGAIWAWRLPPDDPLASVTPVPGAPAEIVPKKATAKEQYYYALFHPELKDQAWRAVGAYFGDALLAESNPSSQNEVAYYIRLADERLGEYYLKQDWYDLAHDVYQRLSLEPYEVRFQTVGHMGLAIVYDRLGNADRVRDHLYEVELRKEVEIGFPFLNEFMSAQYMELWKKYVLDPSEGPPDSRAAKRPTD
jgi:serine/threonine-protein kinase